MKTTVTKRFYQKLDKQIEFISKDKPVAAIQFKNDILDEIEKIAFSPLIYRKSPFFEDENIREMIFKGYRVVFSIKKNEILVFGFYKWESGLKF